MRLFEFQQLLEAMDIDNPLNPIYYTWDEYWEMMNPDDRYHDASAYNWTLEDMNKVRSSGRQILDNYIGPNNKLSLQRDNKSGRLHIERKDEDFWGGVKGLVGEIDGNTLMIEKPYYSPALIKDLKYNGQDIQNVKYVKDYQKIIRQRSINDELRHYDKLIQNFKVRGRQFQLRRDNNGNFAVFNEKGLKVAVAQDEWGAILVSVANEYRGFGLGTMLGKIFREYYPEKNTGGVTASGANQVRRVWENFVREALQNGVYSKLVKAGRIDREKVQAILKDLGPRRTKKADDLPPDPEDDTSGWLLMKHESGVVVYHRGIFEQDYSLEELYPYIMGNSLIRDYEGAPAPFLYYVNYENPRAEKLVLYGSLQIARDEDHGLAYEIEAADFADQLETLDGVNTEEGVAYLEQDIPIIERAFDLEKKIRQHHDPHGEWYSLILEAGESKYS